MTVSNIVELTCLPCYPLSIYNSVGQGKEFILHEFQTEICKKEYGLKVKMTTTKIKNIDK